MSDLDLFPPFCGFVGCYWIASVRDEDDHWSRSLSYRCALDECLCSSGEPSNSVPHRDRHIILTVEPLFHSKSTASPHNVSVIYNLQDM